jgi:hypothetical protein
MKQLVGFAGMLLASSAAVGQPGHVAVHSSDGASLIENVTVGHNDRSGLICQTGARHEPAPNLVVKIIPPTVKIPDNSKQGTRLASIAVSWSNGARFTGKVRLTKNQRGICQLAGMELQLGRDTRKADDYKTSVCTVTATK